MEAAEKEFASKIFTYSNRATLLGNLSLKEVGLRAIPKETIENAVKENFHGQQGMSDKEYFVVELMDWFKNKFFKWVDAPECAHCKGPTLFKQNQVPDLMDKLFLADNVEVYICPRCNILARFPRYNHPTRLLETRKGRCGEWAICFTFLLNVLGYTCRLVVDWTDHVWTEVYFDSYQRWVHFDACENIFDSPLVYEQGWGKKLTYILAFSCEEIQDVTWRYTRDHKLTISRRHLCRESWLISQLVSATNALQQNLSRERKEFLLKRRVCELVELLTPPSSSRPEELQGRHSGSLLWRHARSETGNKKAPYIFTLTEEDIMKKTLHVAYSTVRDKYICPSYSQREISGWESCTFDQENIFKKDEYDWKQTYLARVEGSNNGQLTWKFDLRPLEIKTLSILATSTIFEKGKVSWKLTSEKSSISLPKLEPEQTFHEFQGSQTLEITAHLSDGCWQHAQLFRQPFSSKDFPLKITFILS